MISVVSTSRLTRADSTSWIWLECGYKIVVEEEEEEDEKAEEKEEEEEEKYREEMITIYLHMYL